MLWDSRRGPSIPIAKFKSPQMMCDEETKAGYIYKKEHCWFLGSFDRPNLAGGTGSGKVGRLFWGVCLYGETMEPGSSWYWSVYPGWLHRASEAESSQNDHLDTILVLEANWLSIKHWSRFRWQLHRGLLSPANRGSVCVMFMVSEKLDCGRAILVSL